MATPVQPAASPSPPRPPPPPPHLDTTLTLALALAPRPSSSSFARVRSSPTGDPPPCTECGKRFTSWKALFGHMRCHPERQWRGIRPPLHFRDHPEFTVQEREIAKSLLMLAGSRSGGGKGKKSVLGSSGAKKKERCNTTLASSPGRFATGQALGGCHWEKACADGMVVAAPSNCSALATSSGAMLDLNLPPPGTMPWKSDEDGSLNAALDLKLGY